MFDFPMPSFHPPPWDHPVDVIEPVAAMGDQQHGLVARGGEDVFDELARRPRVEARRRLIEHQHRGAGEQRPREDDPLPLAA